MGTLNWLQSWLPLMDLKLLMQLRMMQKDQEDERSRLSKVKNRIRPCFQSHLQKVNILAFHQFLYVYQNPFSISSAFPLSIQLIHIYGLNCMDHHQIGMWLELALHSLYTEQNVA